MLGKFSLLLTYCVLNLSVSYCWIFTDVNFNSLATRNLEIQILRNQLEANGAVIRRINLIFPGTKWCGAGNIADNYDDLGPSRDTDKCCREHDLCPQTIEGLETKYNLTNEAIYTRLHCNCDEKFRQCLQSVASSTSKIIGNMYFNAIGTMCFKEDYPIIDCTKRGGWLNNKCLEYSFDKKSKKIYQWFDVPTFDSPSSKVKIGIKLVVK